MNWFDGDGRDVILADRFDDRSDSGYRSFVRNLRSMELIDICDRREVHDESSWWDE